MGRFGWTILVVVGILAIACIGPSKTAEYCEIYCDDDDVWHNRFLCNWPPYCCEDKDIGRYCCMNASHSIADKYPAYYNCENSGIVRWWNHYWRTVLGTGIGLGSLTLLCSVSVCIYQLWSDKKHARLFQRHERRRGEGRSADSSEMTTVSSQIDDTGRDPNRRTDGMSSGYFPDPNSVALPPPYTDDKPPPYSA